MNVGLILLVIGAGVLVGVLSALFGVGGGLLMVPFIVIVLDESQHLAEGTSLAVIVPTAIAGVFAYRNSDLVQMGRAALVAVGGIVGALAGAEMALGLAGDSLRRAFGVFLSVMGARLVIQGLRSLRTPTSSGPRKGLRPSGE
jgi:hypothetical protein